MARKLIQSHLVEGNMTPGGEIALRIDQTLTQDATGTLVILELEAIGLERTRAELSAQYVDHNLIQEDHKRTPTITSSCGAPASASASGTAAPATA